MANQFTPTRLSAEDMELLALFRSASPEKKRQALKLIRLYKIVQ